MWPYTPYERQHLGRPSWPYVQHLRSLAGSTIDTKANPSPHNTKQLVCLFSIMWRGVWFCMCCTLLNYTNSLFAFSLLQMGGLCVFICVVYGGMIRYFVKLITHITNQKNKGWISADRSTKATLKLTIPRSIFKSSTKDLSWPTCGIMFLLAWLLVPVPQLYDVDPRAIAIRVTSVKVNIVAFQHGFWLRGVQS